jgi:hypothetical protein
MMLLMTVPEVGAEGGDPPNLYARVAFPKYAHTIDWAEQNRIHTVSAELVETANGGPRRTELIIEVRASNGALREVRLAPEVLLRHGLSFSEFIRLARDPDRAMAMIFDDWGPREIEDVILEDLCHLTLGQ